jgi:ribosome-binding protein aMBF1 (putative translation factor)
VILMRVSTAANIRLGNAKRLEDMKMKDSPVGTTVSDDIKESLKDPEFRAEYERLAPYEELARIVIMRRGALGLTQAELASRMGTTASAISRIESGQHATSAQTLKKLGDAFGARAVLGFEFGSAEKPERELVVL